MKHYITAAGDIYGFEDHVTASPHPDIPGAIRFHDVNGTHMHMLPTDLVPYEIPAPTLEDLREETKRRLRSERGFLFADLDVQFMRNLEQGKDNTDIVAEKQRLRDITKLAEAATTPEQLQAIKP